MHHPRHRAAMRVDIQAGSPGRRFGPVAQDVVAPALLGRKAADGKFRHALANLAKHAPVERPDARPGQHVLRAQHRHDRLCERLRPGRFLRRQRRQLDFDAEPDGIGLRPPSQRQDLRQSGDARAVAWFLEGERAGGCAARSRPADIEARQRCHVEVPEQQRGRRQPRPAGIARVLRVECRVVMHDGNAVPGQPDVELKPVDAEGDRALE